MKKKILLAKKVPVTKAHNLCLLYSQMGAITQVKNQEQRKQEMN